MDAHYLHAPELEAAYIAQAERIAELETAIATARNDALKEAASECECVRQDIASGPAPEGACFDYENAIRALAGETGE